MIDVIEDSKGVTISAEVAYEDYAGRCTIELVHVYDWYDQMERISANCVIFKGVFKTDYVQMVKGVYLICCARAENGKLIFGRSEHEGFDIQRAFCVGHSCEKTDNDVRDIYSNIVNHREAVFSEVKGDIINGTTLFDCFVFVKNLNVYSTIEYGDASVIPYNKYKSLSEAQLIDSFFTNEKVTFDYTSSLREGFAAVIYIKNIMADENGEYAKKYALERASIIANLFSISNHDNCQIVATVTRKKKENTYSIRVIDPIYQGNLLRLTDQGFWLRALYNYLLNNDSNIKVYIKLFNEAVTEENIWASYFKFWVLLEVMAEAYETKGKIMTAWDGTTIYDKDGKAKVIETNFDSVIELMRIKYSHQYNRDFIKVDSIGNIKDFLSVCYQRRCCFAHYGGCNPNNHNLCKQKDQYIRCKSNLSQKKGWFDDRVWSRLESLVRELIYIEIKDSIGKTPRETMYLDELVKGSA